MGTKEKLIERFKTLPTNFTFEEMERLLLIFVNKFNLSKLDYLIK